MCMPFINKVLRRNKHNRNRNPTPAPSATDLLQLPPVGQVAATPEETMAEQTAAAPAPADVPALAPAAAAETTTTVRTPVMPMQSPAAMAIAMAASFAASGRPSRTLSTITSVNSIIANNYAATVQVQEAHNASPATVVGADVADAAAAVDGGGIPAAPSTVSSSGRKKTWLEFFGMSKKKSSIDSL
ncbi:uncharacterized protein LOC111064924 [Drosophila obscura]|uniref:uncharacterized protein LOC111064924 n=1 Tax=Drosophila obscura TaxID=7282 RepID=UPI001BB195C1|nr:uncharacterized protein LOC111064924 [Drosophila obscura]